MLKVLLVLALLLHPSVQVELGTIYNPPPADAIHMDRHNPVYELEQVVQLRESTSLEGFSILLRQKDNPYYEWLQSMSLLAMLLWFSFLPA
ncbi:hypothetical protein BDV23DRAFT_166245 [Aspergillus alliaceus]|uniref:Uncharacterized protein n=1 Tax=Petromyces alliaceus TaxID=209559 RepID=A0A5N7BT14_PETAA|nr:hypothetical protein BDV23DRAFT_166245 [Aspergillus alliaceus]